MKCSSKMNGLFFIIFFVAVGTNSTIWQIRVNSAKSEFEFTGKDATYMCMYI